jgi:hypothetical protein
VGRRRRRLRESILQQRYQWGIPMYIKAPDRSRSSRREGFRHRTRIGGHPGKGHCTPNRRQFGGWRCGCRIGGRQGRCLTQGRRQRGCFRRRHRLGEVRVSAYKTRLSEVGKKRRTALNTIFQSRGVEPEELALLDTFSCSIVFALISHVWEGRQDDSRILSRSNIVPIITTLASSCIFLRHSLSTSTSPPPLTPPSNLI